MPQDVVPSGFITLPSIWSGYKLRNGETASAFGYATYRLKLNPTEPIKEKLAIYLTQVDTAYHYMLMAN